MFQKVRGKIKLDHLIGYCSLSLGPEDISDFALGFSFSPKTQGKRVWKH